MSYEERVRLIRKAGENWVNRMIESVGKPGIHRHGLDGLVIDKRIEYIDLPAIPRLKELAS